MADAPKTPATADTVASDTVAPATDPTLPADGSVPVTGPTLAVVSREHYDVLDEFGRGGLGRVLRARDRRTGRIVAIKEVLRASDKLDSRFAREAVVTANLQHPSIVPVYEVGRWPTGEPFYAMKLVAGRTLLDALRAAKTLRDRLALLPHVIAVADALAYAHGERVIHRDLKPANVLIGDFGETVVIDWGLAKRLDDKDDPIGGDTAPQGDGLTIAGTALGTPGYMPPEQVEGEIPDERADVFAIGAILYELLAGARPYDDSTSVEDMLDRTVAGPPRAIRDVEPDAPAELVTIAEHAMAPKREDRYASGKELAADLRRFQTGQLVDAHHYTPWTLVKRWVRQHRVIVFAAAASLVALGVIGAYSVARIRDARDHALAARADAERERGVAIDKSVALLEDRGRSLLVAGDPDRALPFLAEAYRARKTPALAFMVARALDHLGPLAAVFAQAEEPVESLAWSPDGKRLAAASDDGKVKVWDTDSQRLLAEVAGGPLLVWTHDGRRIFAIHKQQVAIYDGATLVPVSTIDVGGTAVSLARSPDDGKLVAGDGAGHVVWFDRDGKVLGHASPKQQGATTELAISNAGTVAAWTSDHTIELYAGGDKPVRVLTGHTFQIKSLDFDPTGMRLLSASNDATAIVWDVATGKPVAKLPHDNVEVAFARFDLDSRHVITIAHDTLRRWDLESPAQPIARVHVERALAVVRSPDGKQLVLRSGDGTVTILDGTSLQVVTTLTGHAGGVTEVAFSPDGKRLATAAVDRDVRLWRLDARLNLVALDNAGTRSFAAEWSHDGKRIALDSSDAVVRVFDRTAARVAELRGHSGPIRAVAFSSDDKVLASASEDGTAKLWDVATGAEVRTLAGGSKLVRAVAFQPGGKLVATAEGDGAVRLWDAASGAGVVTITAADKLRRVRWSPDGTRLLTIADGTIAYVWDDKGKPVTQLKLVAGEPLSSAWSADGKHVAIGSRGNNVELFDATTGLENHLLFQGGMTYAVEFAPDGKTLLSAGTDGTVRAWDVESGRERYAAGMGDSVTPVFWVAIRGDGQVFASSQADGSIGIWDVATGQELDRVRLPRPTATVAWAPDGSALAIAVIDDMPRVWDIPAFTGTDAELAQKMKCTSSWRLDGSTLVPQRPAPNACH